jgi:hypothetical protein
MIRKEEECRSDIKLEENFDILGDSSPGQILFGSQNFRTLCSLDHVDLVHLMHTNISSVKESQIKVEISDGLL